LKARHLHITVYIVVPLKASTYTLQLLLGTSLKAEYLFMVSFGVYYMSG